MSNKLQITEKITLDNLELLKILSDPTRMEIMKLVGAENKRERLCTVKQVAQSMGVSPTKLYYHVKMLEEHGLLVVGNTRDVSGIIEKHLPCHCLGYLVQPERFVHDGRRWTTKLYIA